MKIKFHYNDETFKLKFDYYCKNSEVYEGVSQQLNIPADKLVLKSQTGKLDNDNSIWNEYNSEVLIKMKKLMVFLFQQSLISFSFKF